jgi:predicted hotdog family 3-hydroxylacyl-ACP dehydratase
MTPCRYAIAKLLPHKPPMILLDALLNYDDEGTTACVTITEASLFLEPDGVPVHVGLEYMAQACGAYAGAVARDKGEPVKIGFMLGTRRYQAHVPYFRLGERLLVSVKVVYRDDQMGAFDCRIAVAGKLAAEAQLTVYQPDPAQLSSVSRTSSPS